MAHICLLLPALYDYPWPCRVVSILIHFFFTAAFMFMFLESLHVYAQVSRTFPSSIQKGFYSSLDAILQLKGDIRVICPTCSMQHPFHWGQPPSKSCKTRMRVMAPIVPFCVTKPGIHLFKISIGLPRPIPGRLCREEERASEQVAEHPRGIRHPLRSPPRLLGHESLSLRRYGAPQCLSVDTVKTTVGCRKVPLLASNGHPRPRHGVAHPHRHPRHPDVHGDRGLERLRVQDAARHEQGATPLGENHAEEQPGE